jgi:hypothetical protein
MLKNKHFPCIITALLLAPWFVYVCQMSINGDTAWLLIAAERLLGGGHMLSDVYENNPPLSLLIHVPPVLLAKAAGLPLYAGALVFFFALIGLSVWAVSALLKRLDFLDEMDRTALLAGFAAAITIMPSISFGEREHILLLGLMPFTLGQLALTWGYRLPRNIAWPVFGLGAVAILLKPHYGVLPVFFLLHRAVKNKSLGFLRDADFIILSAVTALYIVGVWLFFPDYAQILPDALALYVSSGASPFAFPALLQHVILFSAFLGIEATLSALKGKRRELMILLYGSALLCLVPYAVQMKGFYYHLIPAMGFFLTGLAFTLQSYARQYIKPAHWQKIVSLAAIILLAYGNTPLLWAYPSHSDYKNLPMAAQLEKHCPAPCTYFAFHDTLEILSQTTLYTDATHASRFPSLWFLPAIYNGTGLDPAQQKILKDKYAGYVAKDLERYQPEVLFLMSNSVFADGQSFDLARYFSSNTQFSKVMRNYRKTGSFTMNRADYLRGTDLDGDLMLAYDVYTKR